VFWHFHAAETVMVSRETFLCLTVASVSEIALLSLPLCFWCVTAGTFFYLTTVLSSRRLFSKAAGSTDLPLFQIVHKF